VGPFDTGAQCEAIEAFLSHLRAAFHIIQSEWCQSPEKSCSEAYRHFVERGGTLSSEGNEVFHHLFCCFENEEAD
jgi:hypothetical protein